MLNFDTLVCRHDCTKHFTLLLLLLLLFLFLLQYVRLQPCLQAHVTTKAGTDIRAYEAERKSAHARHHNGENQDVLAPNLPTSALEARRPLSGKRRGRAAIEEFNRHWN
jgi:hypothetical protein